MKKIALFLIMCLPLVVMAQNKVAVYVTAESSTIDEPTKNIVGGELVTAIVNTRKYTAVERTSDFLSQISKEQGYQRSGNVDDQQISALGKQFGVDFVCVANIMPYKGEYYIQARLIDVETATVHGIARENSPLANINDIMMTASKVAHKLFESDMTQNTNQPESVQQTSNYGLSTLPPYKENTIISLGRSKGKKAYKYGNYMMNKKTYEEFLSRYCTQSFNKYYMGKQMVASGWVFFAVGLGMMGAGIYMSIDCDNIVNAKYPKTENNDNEIARTNYEIDIEDLSVALASVGATFFATGIVLMPLGYVYKNKAVDIFNRDCSFKHTASCSFNLQSSRDGIGIAICF